MKSIATAISGILAIVAMCCFVGTFMSFQESPSQAGACFVAFLVLAYFANAINPTASR
jgi:hypothetical protein